MDVGAGECEHRIAFVGVSFSCWSVVVLSADDVALDTVRNCLRPSLVKGVRGCAFFADTKPVLMFVYVTTILDGDGLGDHWCVVATCSHECLERSNSLLKDSWPYPTVIVKHNRFANNDGGGSGVTLVEGVECWGWFAFYPGFVVGGGLCTFGFREGGDGVWASCDEAGDDWVVADDGFVERILTLIECTSVNQDGVVNDDVSVVGVLVDYGSVVVEAG